MADMMRGFHAFPPWSVNIFVVLVTATFTNVASNVAAATIFLPIVAEVVRRKIIVQKSLHCGVVFVLI